MYIGIHSPNDIIRFFMEKEMTKTLFCERTPGPWHGERELIELRDEAAGLLDKFFEQYGSCIVRGCEAVGDRITPGVVALAGMDKEQVIELDDGTYHLTVRVSADGAYVSHSDCPTQECVHTGVIRRAGQSIVCLPAQVVVYLEGKPAAGAPDVIVG